MKWIRAFGLLIFALFLFAAIFTIFLETTAGARLVKDFLLRSLARSGIQVDIESISGHLPEEMDLKGVTISGIDQKLMFIETLHLELSLLKLLKKEVAIRNLVASGIQIKSAPNAIGKSASTPAFPLPIRLKVYSFKLDQVEALPGVVLTGNLNAKKKGKLNLVLDSDFYGTSHLDLSLEGTFQEWAGRFQGNFAPDALEVSNPYREWVKGPWSFEGEIEKKEGGIYRFQKMIAQGQFLNFKGSADFDAKGQLIEGHVQGQNPSNQFFATTDLQSSVNGIKIQGQWRAPPFSIEGKWDGQWKGKTFIGKTNASGLWLKQSFVANSDLTYHFRESLQFEKISLESAFALVSGNLTLRSDRLWVGNVHFNSLDLSATKIAELTGVAEGQVTLEAIEQKGHLIQAAHLNASGKEILWQKNYAREATISANLQEDGTSRFHTTLKDAQWKELLINHAEADFGESGPFQLTLDGTLKDPLNLMASGEIWQDEIQLNALKGTFLKHPIALTSPSTFKWKTASWSLQPVSLSIGEGTLLATGGSQEGFTLNMKQLPLDILSLNSLHVNVQGTIDGNASLSETNGHASAQWKASIHKLQIGDRTRQAEGSLIGNLDNERLTTQVSLQSNGLPLFNMEANIPLDLTLWPFNPSFPLNQPVDGRFIIDGYIEDLFDFFDLGPHRFTGHLKCDLLFRNTFSAPRLEGECAIVNGSYENYFTGTSLKDLQATFIAEKEHLRLRSFVARDEVTDGELTGNGFIRLNLNEKFPFQFDLDFSRLNLAQIDLVKATGMGHVLIRGNLDRAETIGNVEILEADFSIPEQLPSRLPFFQVVYKNGSLIQEKKEKAAPYPLHLNLNVRAPKNIFIRGRGLSSEWKGDFHVRGTYTSISTKGTLELLGGEFVFSGRSFTLTEGALSFSGKEYAMPTIDLAGHMAERGIAITARLKGPLNQPELTFQSTPPLPFGSILSYLLFGKDISEIDGFQAIQLASSLAAIGGQTPSVLDNVRKSIGIDRLRITTSSGSEEGSDNVTVQVGKYVAKGVLVSFSQGSDEGTSNVSVEIDLKHGFTFQIETEQEQEQGKFTLKWNVNY